MLADDELALRAGDRLLVAGRRALDRGDERAASALLRRALILTRPLRLDVHAEVDLAAALWGEPDEAARIADDAAARAEAAGDETAAALARAIAESHRFFVGGASPDGLGNSSWMLAGGSRRRMIMLDCSTSGQRSDTASRMDGAERPTGRQHPNRHDSTAVSPVGRLRVRSISGSPLRSVPSLLMRRSTPSRACWRRHGRRSCSSVALGCSPCSIGARRREQDSREADARLSAQAGTRWNEWWLAELSTLDGDHADASRRLRIVCDWLEQTEQRRFLETYLGRLGISLCRLGDFERAEQCAIRAQALELELGGPLQDSYWRQVLARVHAHRGELAEGERLARRPSRQSRRRTGSRPVPRLVGSGRGSDSGGSRRRRSRVRPRPRTRRTQEEPRAYAPAPRAARGAMTTCSAPARRRRTQSS